MPKHVAGVHIITLCYRVHLLDHTLTVETWTVEHTTSLLQTKQLHIFYLQF
jgi:hypothetical protein